MNVDKFLEDFAVVFIVVVVLVGFVSMILFVAHKEKMKNDFCEEYGYEYYDADVCVRIRNDGMVEFRNFYVINGKFHWGFRG